MADPGPRDFTPAERKELVELLGARRKQAWLASGVGVFLSLAFCARMLLGHIKRGDEWIIYGLVAVVVIVIGLIIGMLTWAPVRNLTADLEAGKTGVVEGPVGRIVTVDSKFGETFVYAFVGETRVYTHGALFEGLKAGERVRAIIAPRAHYTFVVEKLG